MKSIITPISMAVLVNLGLYRLCFTQVIDPVHHKAIPEYVKWKNSIEYYDLQCIKYNNQDVPIYKLLDKGSILQGVTCTNYVFFDHIKVYYQYELKPESNKGGQHHYVEHSISIPKVTSKCTHEILRKPNKLTHILYL